MTIDQLKSVMKYHLKNFNDKGGSINDNTVHSDVLSDSDGFGTANSKRIYKALIRRTLKREGHKDRRWPNDWMELSVKKLAPELITK
jgi:hypothetical protein